MTVGVGERRLRVDANIGNADEAEESRASPARIVVAGEVEDGSAEIRGCFFCGEGFECCDDRRLFCMNRAAEFVAFARSRTRCFPRTRNYRFAVGLAIRRAHRGASSNEAAAMNDDGAGLVASHACRAPTRAPRSGKVPGI